MDNEEKRVARMKAYLDSTQEQFIENLKKYQDFVEPGVLAGPVLEDVKQILAYPIDPVELGDNERFTKS